MAQPAKNNILWIDWWVRQQVAQVAPPIPVPGPVLIQTYMTLTQPQELDGWKVCQTSGNANDCMIHSLLIELSSTFQRLPPEVRNDIARTYRTTEFATIPDVDRRRANSDAFLEDRDLLAFGNYYNINILTYIPTNSEFQFVSNDKPGECIIIHYNGYNHYSAMLSHDNSPFIDYRVAEQLSRQFTRKPTDLYCEYAVDSLILNQRGQQKKVIERRFPNETTFKGYKFCNELRVVNPDFNVVIGVDRRSTEWNYIIGEAALAAGKEEISEAIFLTPQQREARQQYEDRQREPPPGSANGVSNLPLPGRSGVDFENYLEDSIEPIILSTSLESVDNQLQPSTKETIKNNTTTALEGLQKDAEIKLKQLEFFNWFFGGEIPKDCEKLSTPQVTATIRKRLEEFESSPRGNLLLTLYSGLSRKKFDSELGDVKAQILALFDSRANKQTFDEIKELCKLSRLQLILNQAENLKTQAKNYGLLQEDGKIVTEGPKWKMLLKNMKLADTIGKADKKAKELIEYLNGPNILSALKKAATYTPEEKNSLLNFKGLPETKWLREFLTTYSLSGFPIQIALDFNSQDIDDAFVKNVDITEKQKEQAEEQNETIINGKTFVKSMVTNMSLPTNFNISDNQFVGNELNEKLVQSDVAGEGAYYVTQKIPFLKEYAEVVLSREITEAVNYFEQFDRYPENENASMNQVSLPLYIIFSCQKRKRKSSKEIAEKKLGGDDIYKKDKNGNFVYDSFHTSIIFLCNGKIYTLGYGSDPFIDDEEKETDSKIKYLKKVEKIVKDGSLITGVDLRGVQLLGTGYIYSPDSLNITEDSFNYSIIDIGILKTSHIVRLNKILATIKKVRAISMVIGKDQEPRNVTVEQLSAQTMCVYSRLASRYNQYFPIAAQFMNCSSFVEAIFYDRITCTTKGLYSDPNSCVKKQNPYGSNRDQRIKSIFDAYFLDGTISAFKKLVDYTSDVTPEEHKIDSLWTRVEKVAKTSLIPGCVAGACLLAVAAAGKATGQWGGENEEIKLKKRRKQKRPKNATAKKLNNK